MKLQEALNTFAVRLYEWSAEEFVRELETGCPLLSLMGLNNRRITGYVSWNKDLATSERKELALALTRRAHSNAALLKGEALTAQDKYWHRLGHEQTTIRMHDLPPLVSADRTLPSFRSADPERCLNTVITSLAPILGKAKRRRSSIQCTRNMGDWKIITEFVFRRSESDLIFEYQFVRKDGAPIRSICPGPFPRTLLMFYGLYESQVDVPSEADSQPMAKVMAKLAEYFVAHAQPLFAGLGIND
jgi:hypothetical protein